MNNPPDYLEGKVVPPKNGGPAKLLQHGQWCGHGEPRFNIFDIQSGDENTFTLQLSESDDEALNAPIVMVKADSGIEFAIYDSRKHPASIYNPMYNPPSSGEPKFQPNFQCPNCGGQKFMASVGFEVPSDSDSPTDTSWFTLAVKCVGCGWEEIIYDDETA